MKDRDNQMQTPDLNSYDEMYISKDEIYHLDEEIINTLEMDKYSFSMNEKAMEASTTKRSKIKAITISTGVLAIIMAFIFIAMKRFNKSFVYNVSCSINHSVVDVSFDFEAAYDISIHYGIKDSSGLMVFEETLSDTNHIDRQYDLDSGVYQFVIFEDIYDYTLSYYESEIIEII